MGCGKLLALGFPQLLRLHGETDKMLLTSVKQQPPSCCMWVTHTSSKGCFSSRLRRCCNQQLTSTAGPPSHQIQTTLTFDLNLAKRHAATTHLAMALTKTSGESRASGTPLVWPFVKRRTGPTGTSALLWISVSSSTRRRPVEASGVSACGCFVYDDVGGYSLMVVCTTA